MNMKTTAKVAMAAIILTMIGCKSKEDAGAYIGPSDIRIENGVMTPETLLSLGRISDAQLSPDGSRILYGVSYTSIEQEALDSFVPIIRKETQSFLKVMMLMNRPARVLEVGTAVGFSAALKLPKFLASQCS